MHSNKKITVCFLYELRRGGETVATELIGDEFLSSKNIEAIFFSKMPSIINSSDRYSHEKNVFVDIIYWLSVLVKTKEIDWVYTTTYTAGIAASILKPFQKFKLVWHYHGTRIPAAPSNPRHQDHAMQLFRHNAVILLHKLFLRFTDLIFVPTSITQKKLLKHYPQIAQKTIVIIPNAVDLNKFRPVSESRKRTLRKQYGIVKEAVVILAPGRISPKKNLFKLVEVFYLLRKSNKNMLLVFAYPTPQFPHETIYFSKLFSSIQKSKYSSAIRWIENPIQVSEVYQISDVVVSLSLTEHFSLIMLEAIASKVLYMMRKTKFSSKFLSQISPNLLIDSFKKNEIASHLKKVLSLDNKEKAQLLTAGYELAKQNTSKQTATVALNFIIKHSKPKL